MKAANCICVLSTIVGLATAQPELNGGRDGATLRPRPSGENAGRNVGRGSGNSEAGRNVAEFLKRADTDRDGAVSRGEFVALERLTRLSADQRGQLFDRLDKNEDGILTPNEIKGLGRPPRGPGGFPPLEELDQNGDKAVSFEEFGEARFVQRLPEKRRRAFFDRLDSNRDGRLTPADKRRDDLRRGPGGRSGGIKPGQGVGGGSKPRFEELDRNRDKSLDFEEFQQVPGIKGRSEDFQEERFEELDLNGDLRLEKQELKGGDRE